MHRTTQKPRDFNKLVQRAFIKFEVARPQELKFEKVIDYKIDDSDPFIAIGEAVANAKNQFDLIPRKDFDTLMHILDLYAGLKRTFREDYKKIISTNASLKMYELIIQMKLLACETGQLDKVRAFCNAELPGAFIDTINFYLRTQCPATNFDWVASSYFPEDALASGDPTILGDQYGLYANNRSQWIMGPRPNAMPIGELPTTGDITDFNVVVSLANAVKSRFNGIGATLYTSDVGIEVKDYNKQEEITAVLNYGQIISGILSLAPGGNLVTKQYTFVTPFSRSVIALVSYFFDKTFIVKPFTSRPLNSEVYLVGIGFQGIDTKTSDILLQYLKTYSASKSTVLSPIIDMSEVDGSILRAARQIHERQQVAFINEAIELYKQWGQQLNQLKKVLSRDVNRVQQEWLSANPVKQIRDDQQLAMK